MGLSTCQVFGHLPNYSSIDILDIRPLKVKGMPQVTGWLDVTLINKDVPHLNKEQYVNWHENCMLIHGLNLQFYYASLYWPGVVMIHEFLGTAVSIDEWNQGINPSFSQCS
jgi:hypothetical protein